MKLNNRAFARGFATLIGVVAAASTTQFADLKVFAAQHAEWSLRAETGPLPRQSHAMTAVPPELCVGPSAQLTGPATTQFGNAVALSASGNTAIVGSWKENSLLGVARVFVRSGPNWTQQGAALTAAGGSGAELYFGSAVSLSADGNTAIVGAHGDNSGVGAAYVFTRVGSTWTQQGSKLIPAGGVGFLQLFGSSVALSADGNTALVGAWHDTNQTGAAYMFVRSSGGWAQQGGRITPSSGTGGYFGRSVSLNADGSTAAIGAPLGNRVCIYSRSGGVWSLQGTPLVPTGSSNPNSAEFGCSVALSSSGNTLIVGSQSDNRDGNGNGLGAVYFFQRNGASWSQQGPNFVPDRPDLRYFGFSVCVSGDGNAAIVGMPGGDGSAGAAYLFARSGSTWLQQGQPLVVPAGNFGNSAALNSDGTTAMIGAWNESRVHVYSISGSVSISQQPSPVAICPTNGATFGVSAAGTSPTYRWQREAVPDSNIFVNLLNGSASSWDGGDGGAIVFGATTSSLIVVPDSAGGRSLSAAHAIRYRCVVSNACGPVSSDPAKLSICRADFDCSGYIDDADFVVFAIAYDLLLCSDPNAPPGCPADVNGDQFVDDADFAEFARSYDALLCS